MTRTKNKLSAQRIADLAKEIHYADKDSDSTFDLYDSIVSDISAALKTGSDDLIVQALQLCKTIDIGFTLLSFVDDCADTTYGVGTDGNDLSTNLFSIPVLLDTEPNITISDTIDEATMLLLIDAIKGLGAIDPTASISLSPKLYTHAEMEGLSFIRRSKASRMFARGLVDKKSVSPSFSDDKDAASEPGRAFYLVGASCASLETDVFIYQDISKTQTAYLSVVISCLKRLSGLASIDSEKFYVGLPNSVSESVMLTNREIYSAAMALAINGFLLDHGISPKDVCADLNIDFSERTIAVTLFHAGSGMPFAELARNIHDREIVEEAATQAIDVLIGLDIRQKDFPVPVSVDVKDDDSGAPSGYLLH